MKTYILVFFLLLSIPIFGRWSVSGELTHYDIAQPGERLARSVEIQNQSNEDLVIIIKKSDYAFNAEGQRWFIEAGKLKRSNAGWIDLSNQEIIVKGKSNITFEYRVNVPDNKDLSGSYWSLLFIQEKADTAQTANNIQINQRYAIQSIVQIENSGDYNIEFLNAEFSKTSNNFDLKIKNNGTRWIKANVWLEVYDQNGKKIGKFSAQPIKLYPETSIVSQIPLISLNKGKYYIVAVVDCGNNKIFGSQYTLEK